jgi:hypothetical protein
MTSVLKSLLLINLFLCSLALGSQAQNNLHATNTESKIKDTPLQILERAERLDDSAVGYAGERTETYSAFIKLYGAGKPSTDSAKHLIAQGTPAGKVYGYLILRHVAPLEAGDAAKQLLKDQTAVPMMNGCFINSDSVSRLVARIQKGEMIIYLPKAGESAK